MWMKGVRKTMTMNRFLIAILLAGVSALAQDTATATLPPPAEKHDAVVLVRLKYADPELAARLLSHTNVSLATDRTLHLMVISGDPDRVMLAQKIIQDIDVPGSAGVMLPGPPVTQSDIEFTVYLLAGLNKGEENSDAGAPSALRTKALDGTVSQLRAIFPYASYRLLDTAVLRVNGNSSGEVGGILPLLGEAGDTGLYSIGVQVRGIVPKEHESQISVHELRFSMHPPKGGEVSVRTALELREGQQVVVGKAAMGNAGTLFVVVSARVLQ
jgi:hypothetical protein